MDQMSGSITLVFETSTPHASIALAGADGHPVQREFCSDRNHNAMLFEPLSDLMKDGSRHDIGLVLVGSGPGSYSGTRVGIAAAQGVAIALGCPAVAVPSILAVRSAENGTPCVAIGDARRGSYWSAKMENSRLVEEPALRTPEELTSIVSSAIADGIPVFSFEEQGRFPVPDILSNKVIQEVPDASRLWKAWTAASEETRMAWSAIPPQPLYLKPPHITPGKRPPLVRP